MSCYAILSDSSNYRLYSHNVADMGDVDELLYSGTSLDALYLVLVKKLMGANNEIRTSLTLSADLTAVTTAALMETYYATNETEILAEMDTIDRD